MGVELVVVTEAEAGQKLLSFLQRRLDNIPISALQKAIRKGQVRVDSRRSKPFERVELGQKIRIPPFDNSQKMQAGGISGKLSVVHEQKDFLLINKPAGLAVHGGSKSSDSVISRLKNIYLNSDFAPTPIHRLDKNTSGLLLLAKSYSFLRLMQEKWQKKEVQKIYLAWVKGSWIQNKPSLLVDSLEKKMKNGREKVQAGAGKRAESNVFCLLASRSQSLLKVKLGTGRTHQIRVQLSSRGYPIIGDLKYQGPACEQGMLLHAYNLVWDEFDFSSVPDWQGGYAIDENLL